MSSDAVEILFVDDNPADVELTLRAFEKAHIANKIHVVHDGEEALDFLFRRGNYAGRLGDPLPKLVLLDLKLPKVEGLEVLRLLRSDPRTRAVPVVILTSSKEERDLASGYQFGANSYIEKPVDFVQFEETVRQLGLYWMVINQPPPRGRATPA